MNILITINPYMNNPLVQFLYILYYYLSIIDRIQSVLNDFNPAHVTY
jgi:hypothetical protein